MTQPSSECTVALPPNVNLHARPAAEIARVALGFESEIGVGVDGRWSDAKSALTMLTLGATGGSTVKLRAGGPDAAEALEKLSATIEALAG